MPSTYSSLKIQLMATGENNTTWGDVTNLNLGTALEEAIVGSADVAFSNANVTLTLTDTNASQAARNMRLNLTGTATAGYNLIVPAIEKPYIVNNGTDGTITVKNSTGTGIAVPAGKTVWVYNNGTNVVDVVTHLSSLTLNTALTASSGGTGQSSYTTGDLLYASGATALSKLADVATGNALISGGVGVAPSWGKIGLTTHVSGTLPVANGGTNLTAFTANGVMYASSTSVLATGSAFTFDGTNLATTGTASATKFIPTGGAATGNGMYLPAANTVAFSTNGSERMRVSSSGNVSIGNTNNTFKLDVSGTSYFRGNSTFTGINGVTIDPTSNGTTDGYFQMNCSNAFNALNFFLNNVSYGGILAVAGGQTYYSFGSHVFENGARTVEYGRFDSSGNFLITGAGGIGYGTGSGGAVTQITSRTTGVTLNKTNGAITLVSAAGTTTWQSFTVTNSTVAATDVVVVSQKSGTDLYHIFVTNVAAGSFRITFATTGGTTTEQPVFNFAVIKAVTA